MKPIYLILDTNIWLYLANSFNPSNNNYEEGLHLKLIQTLKNFLNEGSIKLLTTSIVIDEWKKNKAAANNLIKKYKASLKSEAKHIKNLKKHLDKTYQKKLDEVFENFSLNINNQILTNEKHISDVEDILKNKTKIIDVTENTMAKAAQRALKKLAPFKGDKSNSMADALILLSSIEYIKDISKVSHLHNTPFYIYKESIFISSNKKDYSDPSDKNEAHPELKPLFNEINMRYTLNLGNALNQVKEDIIKFEELQQIEKEMNEEYWKNVLFCDICDSRDSFPGIIDFETTISIKNELPASKTTPISALGIDSRGYIKKEEITSASLGKCDYCSSDYLKCSYCGTPNHFDEYIDDNRLECEGCGLAYNIEYLDSRYEELDFEIKIVK